MINPLIQQQILLESTLATEYVMKGKKTQKFKKTQHKLGKLYKYKAAIFGQHGEEVNNG